MKEKTVKAIKKEVNECNDFFLKAIWREQKGDYLETATRFEKLVEWLDKEIEVRKDIIQVLHPSQDSDYYVKAYFTQSVKCLQDLAFFVMEREYLLDNRTTNKERECIERRICKVYNIHYNKDLGAYV